MAFMAFGIHSAYSAAQKAPAIMEKQYRIALLYLSMLFVLTGVGCVHWQAAPAASNSVPTAQWRSFADAGLPDLFAWTDTATVYVLRDGDAALLIDLGDGSVLDYLFEIGVNRVEWVLFTHHHREQCQGAPRLKGSSTKVAAPEAERALFENPANFRKMNVSLGDAFTIHGSSYVRPPIQAVPLDRTFRSMDTFSWHGREFWCVDTRGNSPGGMSYMLKHNGRHVAFSGDVMLDGATMHTWYDSEWDYGFAAGIRALHNSAALLADFQPSLLLPSHGPAVREPKEQLLEFQKKLRKLERLYVRGYEVSTFSAATQDSVSKPSAVPHLWQISPHLYKFKGPDFWPNFGILLADSGHALVIDCGLLDEKSLDTALQGMRDKLGLKTIDAAVITHMHGDHFLEAPYLREKWGTRIWAIDCMADVCEHPERFDYAAPIQAYGKKGVAGLRFDRLFKRGESFDWEGYKFTIDWMPGQTEFALCLHGQIDGRKVAFTGDNIFADPADPTQTGHEAVVAHNSAILEEGYIYAGEYLDRLKPDVLVGGHSFVMDRPAQLIERYRKWAYEMRSAFQSLSSCSDYRYGFDPFWVRAEPYRITLRRGDSRDVLLHIRNFRNVQQQHGIEIHLPPGLTCDPPLLEGVVASESGTTQRIRLKASDSAQPGTAIIAFDITIDGQRFGERFDMVVKVD